MSTSKYKSNKTEDNRQNRLNNSIFRSSLPEVFFEKDVLEMCNKFTREHPYRSGISIKLLCNFTKIALRRGCSRVNLLHIFRTPFPKNASGGLPLYYFLYICNLFILYIYGECFMSDSNHCQKYRNFT